MLPIRSNAYGTYMLSANSGCGTDILMVLTFDVVGFERSTGDELTTLTNAVTNAVVIPTQLRSGNSVTIVK